MLDYGYFLVALLLFAFFGSKWIRPILQCLLHSFVYFIVSISSKLKQNGLVLFKSIRNRMNRNAGSRSNVKYDELAAEKEAVETWNLSLASEVVDLVIVPISLLIQLLIILGVLQYVVDTAGSVSSSNASGPWGVLGTNSIFDITVVIVIVQVLCVIDLIYIGYLVLQGLKSYLFNWTFLDDFPFTLPTGLFTCIGIGMSGVKSTNPTGISSSNHPALARLHATQLQQDLQQENFSSFIDTVIHLLGGVVLILMIFTGLNVDMSPVWGGLAIGACGLAFASSVVLQNLIGTACIFVCGAHRIGDIITLNQTQASSAGLPQAIQGVVKRITPFYTYIYGYDSNYTIVPNGWFISNIARVWRSSDQMCQAFLFIFGSSITKKQIQDFKKKFRTLLDCFEELDANESYTWLQYGDFSTVRYQAVVYASNKNAYAQGPEFLYNMSLASSSRADCDPSLEAQRFNKLGANQAGTAEEDNTDEKKERLKEQEELELPGNRPFFNAAQQFYMELHTWCLENNYPQIETMLYT